MTDALSGRAWPVCGAPRSSAAYSPGIVSSLNRMPRRSAHAWSSPSPPSGEQRQRLILEALGSDRITVSQIAKRRDERYRE